ncbi:2-dehydropantoate 2-reductase [Penicillium riverlandense]|uniref:2-dehydropantoate 2-reductase n=1 Tax=Penicillium riverlandense TaxID=1903569 RepID=UPI0025484CC7|nr:2-dehydropantoate 2-reductase [Penicillium riverlandense]KAJ5819806.1 2-dehydropantoate 2-reductase [Penicillium riverlandense]
MQDVDEIARETNKPRLSGRVHILGLGNVGCFVAHSLAWRQSPPPITLMLHNPEFYEDFLRKKSCISINTNGLDDIKTGFDVNVFHNNSWRSIAYGSDADRKPNEAPDILASAEKDEGHIECLVATVKANHTVNALKTVSHRLTADSTICILQNGMGTMDLLNREVFPDPATRPKYLMGIVSHGLMRAEKFLIRHMGVGTTILAPVARSNVPANPAESDTSWAPTTKYLLRLLTLTPQLVAVAERPTELIQYQLEKLAVNCVVNPLTALMDCKNGELLGHLSLTRVMRLLLFEISSVICALPELQGIPGLEERFSPERLRKMAVNIMYKTRENSSSMLQDVQSARVTEIEFLNGYIVRRGEELGIKPVLNYTMMNLVKGKSFLAQARNDSAIPIDFVEDDDFRTDRDG